ncbi:family 10 glycosylhydrolase [soil metagenome]
MKIRNLFVSAAVLAAAVVRADTPEVVPDVPREFRGVWVASTSNIDWPISRSSSVATQQSELVNIMDRAVANRMNAIVFQVRPECDAFYQSSIEPWSYFLTGLEGRAPNPVWDPLTYAINVAHARGLELHAWVNPYRAKHGSYTTAANHISKTHPEYVVTYGSDLWLDPGLVGVQNYSASVIMDIETRYDVDAIHIDDYFYPYPVSGSTFDDSGSYASYRNGGGLLSLANWRRKNVDDFIQRINTEIHQNKSWVRFGISPFGIWQPGYPTGTVGLNSYMEIYADSKKWFNNGWLDYFAPQIYWRMTTTGHSYPSLMDWWITQNTQHRHLWPGLYTGQIQNGTDPWTTANIVDEVQYTQNSHGGATGNVHFSEKVFRANTSGINGALTGGVYAKKALVPATTWLDNTPPDAPAVEFTRAQGTGLTTLTWTPQGPEAAWQWVVQYYSNGTWKYEILPSTALGYAIPGGDALAPTNACVTAIDRVGNQSARVNINLLGLPLGGTEGIGLY